MRRHSDDRDEVVTKSCLELLCILAAIIVGELVWIVLFTWIALWLRAL